MEPACSSRRSPFGIMVLGAVAQERQRHPSAYHGGGQIVVASETDGNGPAIAVALDLVALDWATSDQAFESGRGLLTGAPTVRAFLAEFRGVDSEQPVRGTIELQGIAIDHGLGLHSARNRQRYNALNNPAASKETTKPISHFVVNAASMGDDCESCSAAARMWGARALRSQR